MVYEITIYDDTKKDLLPIESHLVAADNLKECNKIGKEILANKEHRKFLISEFIE
ncbi:hypothetical protein ACFOZ1_15140 [Gracilibacillus marinus]|uniref:Uncharacterized protein n=1 Tax=Gracilibacillus marinus TaxID=630535 RepID=A0ABV8VYY5_9BACI